MNELQYNLPNPWTSRNQKGIYIEKLTVQVNFEV